MDKNVSISRGNDYRACSHFIFPPIQELFYWLLLVGFTVRVPQSDVNDGVSLTLL